MKTKFLLSEKKQWHIIDAKDQILGKVASKAASLLKGKHRADYSPMFPMGDFVIIINAKEAVLTGGKSEKKLYRRHSGYLGSLRSETYHHVLQRKPLFPMEHAVKGMLPKNRLGRKLFTRLRVFAGADHPHAAQQPMPIQLIHRGAL